MKRRKDGGVVIEDDEGESAIEEHVGTVHGLAVQSVTTTEYGGGFGDQGSASLMPSGGQIPGIETPSTSLLLQAYTLY